MFSTKNNYDVGDFPACHVRWPASNPVVFVEEMMSELDLGKTRLVGDVDAYEKWMF